MRSNGNFDPPWESVMLGLDGLARSCGWKDRQRMKQAVLKSRGELGENPDQEETVQARRA